MRHVKLSVKVVGGFGVILLLMLIVVVIYQVSSSKTTSGFSGLLAGDVATSKHAMAIESALLKARRDEKDFVLQKDMKFLGEHAKNIEELIASAVAIQKIKAQEGDKKTVEEVGKIIELAKKYRQNFETFVDAQVRAGLDSNSGAQGVFHSAADTIAESLPRFSVDDLLIALLQLRRYEKVYISSEREKDKEKFIKVMDAYEAVLKNSTCDPEAKESQGKLFKKYKRWAQEFFETDDSVYGMEIDDSLRELAREIESSINSVRVPDSMAMFLDIRKNEQEFILHRDQKYVSKNQDAVAKLLDAFAKSGILQKHIDSTVAGITAYQNAFNEMVAEYEVMDSAAVAMMESVNEIEPVVAKIIVDSSLATKASTVEISSLSDTLSNIAIIAAAITFLFGVVFSFVISRSITGPINRVVRWMISGAQQVSAASSQILSSSEVLAEGSSEQASAIEEVSAAMEEMSSMTRQNADSALQADSLMREALKTTQGTDQSMDEMGKAMEKIASASEDTSKIIKTIDEIAFQTNLLALNAAVEAARAGEAGAGFAVVADEVRNLAMRATEAAKSTAGLIEGTIMQVNSGKDIVAKTTEGFREVADNSAKVASLVEEIATASREQAQGLSQITKAITQMDSVTQQNSASAEESAAASQELSSQSESMMEAVRDLKAIVDGNAKSDGVTAQEKPPRQKTQQLHETRTPARFITAPPTKKTETRPKDVFPMDDDDFEDF